MPVFFCYHTVMSKTTSKHPRITAYVPEKLLAALKAQAKREHRSMNAQLVWCLEQCLERNEGTAPDVRL
jgi:hypothetical protein